MSQFKIINARKPFQHEKRKNVTTTKREVNAGRLLKVSKSLLLRGLQPKNYTVAVAVHELYRSLPLRWSVVVCFTIVFASNVPLSD